MHVSLRTVVWYVETIFVKRICLNFYTQNFWFCLHKWLIRMTINIAENKVLWRSSDQLFCFIRFLLRNWFSLKILVVLHCMLLLSLLRMNNFIGWSGMSLPFQIIYFYQNLFTLLSGVTRRANDLFPFENELICVGLNRESLWM